MNVCRQTTLRVVQLPNAKVWALVTTLRETVAQDFLVLARTPVQLVFEVGVFTEALERKNGKQTAAEVAKTMNDMQQQGTLKFSDLNLHIKTESSLDQSLIVWRRGLSLSNVLK